mmetsp:Transcript_57748/g.95825  ORF Transcript_57748/g.95825 Transcript_57748/m.95825 type:complete len:111 (+) Transcript_57748:974-1306(+)
MSTFNTCQVVGDDDDDAGVDTVDVEDKEDDDEHEVLLLLLLLPSWLCLSVSLSMCIESEAIEAAINEDEDGAEPTVTAVVALEAEVVTPMICDCERICIDMGALCVACFC